MFDMRWKVKREEKIEAERVEGRRRWNVALAHAKSESNLGLNACKNRNQVSSARELIKHKNEPID